MNAPARLCDLRFTRPEGVVVWHDAAGHSFKVTLEKDAEWKGKAR